MFSDTRDELIEIISGEEITTRVKALAGEINRDYKGQELIAIGILKGAFIFLADLVRQLTMPVQIDFVRLASYGSSMESSGKIAFSKDIELDVGRRHVLVVEDIVDTGYTLKYLKDVLELKGPESVKVCCLIDKKERRKVDIEVDYVGFEVPKGFLVGYGLDYNEQYRNLPGIFNLNPSYEPRSYIPSER